MRRERMRLIAWSRRTIGLVAGALLPAMVANAQTQPTVPSKWRVGASVGGYAPLSSVIVAADSHDTRLGSGPLFSLELQYVVSQTVSIYGNGTLSFSTITLGSTIQPGVVGPSNQVRVTGGLAGIVLTARDWFGEHFQPTLRLGGGIKWYAFDLSGAEDQIAPTADIGLGFRGVVSGPIDLAAEIRYLPSTFDQAKLPTRGVAPQDQRQNDLVFTVGIGIRP